VYFFELRRSGLGVTLVGVSGLGLSFRQDSGGSFFGLSKGRSGV
jgi:hypothetical protein